MTTRLRPIRKARALARAIADARDGVDVEGCLALAAWLAGDADGSEVAELRADRAEVLDDLARRFPGVEPAFLAHELLLATVDGARRSGRGVYTTPRALADFVVASADRALREQLGLPLGLADRATWGELAARGLVEVPDGVDPDAAFVRVLEPAAGSGAFLAALVRRMHASLGQRWEAFAEEELGRRIVGLELLEEPRALATANLERVLSELGAARCALDLRASNPLVDPDAVPRDCTVVVGNPPWSVRSGSLEPAARALVDAYRFAGGERVVEKGALRLEMHLQDDYVKFAALAQRTVVASGAGVVALVTNNSWLDTRTLRGMRASLSESFRRLWIVDLRGARARRGATPDESVFGIAQGTSVLVGARGGDGECVTRHAELAGTREEKLARLAQSDAQGLAGRALEVGGPSWFFVPRRSSPVYDGWVGLGDLFERSVSGIVTAHDRLVVDFDDGALRERAELLLDASITDDEVRRRLGLRDNAGWKLAAARERFRADPGLPLRDYAYRPFDTRRILYHPALVWCDRRRLMQHLDGRENAALVVCRQLVARPWRHVFATRDLVDDNLVSNRSRERSHCFPLYVRAEPDGARVANLDPEAVERVAGGEASPEELLAYVYARLWAASYRERYEDSLASDFPRLPPARDREQFAALAALGAELLDAHLGSVTCADLTWSGPLRVDRRRPAWEDGAVSLGEGRIDGVPRDAFELEIGAYAPARKWLADRAGRELTATDRERYAEVVGRLLATLDVVRRIDDAIQ